MKNKSMIIMTIAMALTLAFTATAFAQGETPTTPYSGNGPGFGMRDGIGMRGTPPFGTGDMHPEMSAVYAEELGISIEELEAACEDGSTFYDLATEAGWSQEEILAVTQKARDAARQAALDYGLMTEEQVEWMSSRGNKGGRGMNAPRGGGFGQGNLAQ